MARTYAVTLLIHAREALYVVEIRARATKSVLNAAFFVPALYRFGFLALASGHVAPFWKSGVMNCLPAMTGALLRKKALWENRNINKSTGS